MKKEKRLCPFARQGPLREQLFGISVKKQVKV